MRENIILQSCNHIFLKEAFTIYKAYKKAREVGHAVMITTLTTGSKKDLDIILKVGIF